MRARPVAGHHGWGDGQVTSAVHAGTPKLYRRPDLGLVGGVAAGIAVHLGMRPALVRVALIALAFAGGLGVALYGAYWIVVPAAPGVRGRLPTWLEYVVGVVLAVGAIGGVALALPSRGLFVPTILACLGGALIWRQAATPERDRIRRLSHDSLVPGNRSGRVRLVVGAALVVAGGVIVLVRADVTAVRDGVIAVLVTVVGLALLTGPWWMRMVSQLGAERSERIRSQERADIAAHLHDSVLQTLALIQRNAADPREVARLARGQERDLRTLLYGDRAASGQLAAQLRKAAAEVEDDYAVTVDVVLVGDAALTDDLAALVAAAREAMVNAAKHSQTTNISLYAEVEQDSVHVFVRDRGVGFDPAGVGDDRQGVRGSIVDRIQRHGGTASIVSSPESGTEVRLEVPR